MAEMVKHPSHYSVKGKPECWDMMEQIFGREAVIIFDVLNSFKYNYRAGEKPDNPAEQDLSKAQFYLGHALGLIDREPTMSPVRADVVFNKMGEWLIKGE